MVETEKMQGGRSKVGVAKSERKGVKKVNKSRYLFNFKAFFFEKHF